VALCKMHHWAFDQGLLVIEHDSATGAYEVIVPDDVAADIADTGFTLSALLEVAGAVARNGCPRRLPTGRTRSFFGNCRQRCIL
jgi:hypothetical protein